VVLFIILQQKIARSFTSVIERLIGVRSGHVAGLGMLILALLVFDNNGVAVVGFIATHGIGPRGLGMFLIPLVFYVFMAWLYFLNPPAVDATFIPPILYTFGLIFMVQCVVHDQRKLPL
jgi:hypothetical protein